MRSKAYIAFGIVLLLFILSQGDTLAAEGASSGGYLAGYENADPNPTGISWWSTAAYLASLFVIFAFVVGMAYVAARFLGGHFAKGSVRGERSILTNLPLGPGKSVAAVELAGRVFLLGVTDQSITLLTEVTDEDEIEKLREERQVLPPGGDLFNQQFGALSDLVKNIPPLFRK